MRAALCDLDYIYEPVTPYRRDVMAHVRRFMPDHADVLDLGCGAVGHYWALGYAHKVASITLGDCNAEMVGAMAQRIDALTPDGVAEEFGDIALPAGMTHEAWLEGFHSRLADVAVMDALGRADRAQYDAVLALELFECANDPRDLTAMVSYCAEVLKPGGKLIGCVLNYGVWNDALERLVDSRMLGRMNPTAANLAVVMAVSGLRILEMDSRDTGMANHPVCHFFCAEKPV